MANVSKQVRQEIWARAEFRCEYCQSSMRLTGMPLVIDHVHPKALKGSESLDNLAAACYRCNEFKGARTSGFDPETQKDVTLFNPREHDWSEHLGWDETGTLIQGLTPMGRATVAALRLNNDDIVAARAIWVK